MAMLRLSLYLFQSVVPQFRVTGGHEVIAARSAGHKASLVQRPETTRGGTWLRGTPTSLAIALAECHARVRHPRLLEPVRATHSGKAVA
jgi:hypothetical protein